MRFLKPLCSCCRLVMPVCQDSHAKALGTLNSPDFENQLRHYTHAAKHAWRMETPYFLQLGQDLPTSQRAYGFGDPSQPPSCRDVSQAGVAGRWDCHTNARGSCPKLTCIQNHSKHVQKSVALSPGHRPVTWYSILRAWGCRIHLTKRPLAA